MTLKTLFARVRITLKSWTCGVCGGKNGDNAMTCGNCGSVG